jgi:heme exporter protein A
LSVVLVVLSAHNLSLVKGERLLFEQINFSVNAGNLLYITGPNGAGKTSLLRTLCGFGQGESGEVHFLQQNILDCAPLFQQKLVYFGHKSGLNAQLSAVENLVFWCRLHAVMAEEPDIYRVLADLSLLGLEDIAVGRLSAGQQRRVALARLWLKQTADLWILDEPFTALDKQGIALLNNKMLAFLSRGGVIVTTSHQALSPQQQYQELHLEYRW